MTRSDEDEAGDAWGWGDEDNERTEGTHQLPSIKSPIKSSKVNGQSSDAAQEITLTEVYSITDIPDHLVEVIGKDLYDSEEIKAADLEASSQVLAIE